MPTKEFVMRGKTASGEQEVLNFGSKHGYAYRLVKFQIFPSTGIGSTPTGNAELAATVTAAKTYEDPSNPNFNNEGLIACTLFTTNSSLAYSGDQFPGIVNDTFLITQNLILAVIDTEAGSPQPVNWQCRFKPVKMSDTELANANLRQFHIFDE